MGSYKSAIKIFDKYPNIADPEIKTMIIGLDSENDELFENLLAT